MPNEEQPTRDSVLSVSAAARALGGRRIDAVAWMRGVGLVHAGPSGRELVIWGDVLDALRRNVQPLPTRRRLATV